MKFTIDRDPLLGALLKTQNVVEKKNTVAILANVLCSVSQQELSIFATDLEVGVKIRLPIENSEEGKLTLSAKHILDIVKELPPQKKIEITRKENHWIELVSGKSKFNIVSLPADEFPALPDFESKKFLEARTDALKQMIDCTHFAVSTDATRYNLTGVYFEPLESNLMRMTAIDGHRLSFVDHEVFLKTPDLKRGMIIPKKGLGELRKLLEESSSSVSVAFEKGYFFARNQNVYLFVRLIEGEYPEYRQIIPKATQRVIKIKHQDFYSALKRVSLLAHEKSKAVKFIFQENLLTITSSNPDMGEAKEELDIEYSAEDTEVGFNSKYLLDYLAVVNSEYIEFSFKDRQSPGILRGVGQQNHTYVIMPMRI